MGLSPVDPGQGAPARAAPRIASAPAAATVTSVPGRTRDKVPFYRVGLTGNVAAGKSAVLDLFTQWGAAAVDHLARCRP